MGALRDVVALILKIVTFFLLFMAILGMFGKWRNKLLGRPSDRNALPRPGRCKACGKFRIGRGPCDCGKG